MTMKKAETFNGAVVPGRNGATKDRVAIFDTTLRDGEQSPGCTMHAAEKLRVAHALADLGVDVIEAGFPIASPGDFESVRAIARQVRGPIICGLARCTDADIDRAWEAVRDADRPRIHVFLATSAIHRDFKLNMAKRDIVQQVRESVSRARACCADVEFSPEDASRTEADFLAEVVAQAVAAGATTINIPDTVGYAVPEEYGALFQYLRANVPGIDDAVLSAHCHDDLGMAVANSLAAVRAGARQVECTINGIGERAGNCALEEFVMALVTRADHFEVDTGIRTRRLYPVSRLVSSVTGNGVPSNKSVVGDNAFAHEAGIHQHGVLCNRATYEIMRPEDVGLDRNRLVLGKHSGRHAFRERVTHLGIRLDDVALEKAFNAFKALADKKKHIYDPDIEALALTAAGQQQGGWELRAMQVTAGTGSIPTASVELEHADGRHERKAAVGDGPVDAVFKALESASGMAPKLHAYRVRSVTEGEDAQGEVVLEVEHGGGRYHGRGVSTDVVEASARAFIDVLNRIERLSRSAEACGAVTGGAG
jgi:2-isopropylmalate synthase